MWAYGPMSLWVCDIRYQYPVFQQAITDFKATEKSFGKSSCRVGSIRAAKLRTPLIATDVASRGLDVQAGARATNR